MTVLELLNFVKKLVCLCELFRLYDIHSICGFFGGARLSTWLNVVPSLQHYSELPDIKRVIVNTHAIEPQVFLPLVPFIFEEICRIGLWLCNSFQSLVEFFGTLSREWALECMKDLLLVNLRGNLQIIVQVLISFIISEYKWDISCRILYLNHDVASLYLRNACVQVAKEYSEQLGVDQCIKLFEQFKSYEGLYFFLGSYLSSR